MHRVLLLALLCSCAADAPTSAHPAIVADAVAAETALVVVNLHPDGSLDIGEISPRPIPFRQPGPVFEQARHGARPEPTPAGSSAGTGGVNDPDTPGIDAPPPRVLSTHGAHAIVVRGGAQPMVVPIDLGHPGEGGGDVLDRWQEGSVILHAPYYGADTRYTIVRMAPDHSVALAEKAVRP